MMEYRTTGTSPGWRPQLAPPALSRPGARSVQRDRLPRRVWDRALGALLAGVLATLFGCAAGPVRGPVPLAPEPEVPAATWRQVEHAIVLASFAARRGAAAYARDATEQWMGRVRQYTEETFIPWYLSYWTQEWLAVKVAGYGADHAEGDAAAVRQLAEYLREKYVSKVLDPASEETDPSRILDQATAMYVRALGDSIEGIGERYQLPEDAFRNRLDQIPAIDLGTASEPGVSLGRLIRTHELTGLPAYGALMRRITTAGLDVSSRPSENSLSPVASAVAETFVGKIAVRGGAAAAAAVVGGPAGFAVSLGITGWRLAEHEKRMPELEAQLRAILGPALEQMQRDLLDDPQNGVLGAVNHVNGQIEHALWVAPTKTQWPQSYYPW